MNENQKLVVKEIERIKDVYDLQDLYNELCEISNKVEISKEEYDSKIANLYKKYQYEMNVISNRNKYVASIGRTKNTVSCKELLIDTIISIACIKVCEKVSMSYTNDDINSYIFILKTMKSIKLNNR